MIFLQKSSKKYILKIYMAGVFFLTSLLFAMLLPQNVNAEIIDQYAESDLLSEKSDSSSDDPSPSEPITSKTMTFSYDTTLYNVSVDGMTVSDGTQIELTSSAKNMTVTSTGDASICVICGGKILSAVNNTYQLQLSSAMTKDSVDKIYICSQAYYAYVTSTLTEDNGKYKVSYPAGQYVPANHEYLLCVTLLSGYKHSTFDLFSDGSTPDGHSIGDFIFAESLSDTQNGVYVYRCLAQDWTGNHTIRIAGSGAQSVYKASPIKGDAYTARFFSNGSYTDVSATYNTALSSISTPSKTGYQFLGWYTVSGEKYDFSTKITHNLNLIAHWEEVCNVTFTGETINTTTKTITKNSTLSKPVTPVRLGYRFLGWYTDSYGSSEFNFSTAVTQDLTLYGLWAYDPININYATVTKIDSRTYTAAAICPSVTVTYSGMTLTAGVDYNVSYSSNVKVGTATVTITGAGIYTGSRNVHFLINPKTTTIKKVNNSKKKCLTVSWKKMSGAAGYKIYRSTSKNGKYTKIASVKSSKLSYTDKKVSRKKTYYYKVTVIAKSAGQYYESTLSKVKSAKVK